jgi:hypothetical protein
MKRLRAANWLKDQTWSRTQKNSLLRDIRERCHEHLLNRLFSRVYRRHRYAP